MLEKVIIGVVSYRGLSEATHIGIINLLNHPDVIGHCVHTGSLLPEARNKLIADLTVGFTDWTHLLLIDSDTTGFTPDHLTKLINAQVDIIGGVLPHRTPPFQPALGLLPDPETINTIQEFFDYVLQPDTHPRRINQVSYVGLAFTLITRRVIEQLPKPLFFTDRPTSAGAQNQLNELIKRTESGEEEVDVALERAFILGQQKESRLVGEDINFCRLAESKGFQSWIHMDVILQHLGECRYSVMDYWNILQGAKNRLEQQTIGVKKGK